MELNIPDFGKVFIFSMVAYVYLWIIAKLLGKKQIAQLSFIDYVVGITIGSIAAEMATETVEPFYHYLIAMFVFLVFDLAVTYLGRLGNPMKKLFIGKPIIIINDGKFDYDELKKSKLTVEEITGMARDKGYFDLNDIAFAVLETSGKLSVLPKCNQKPIVAEDMNITPAKPKLTSYVVIDGEIDKGCLSAMGRDKNWLMNELHVQNKKDFKNILLAFYDEKEKNFTVHYKVVENPQNKETRSA